MWNRILRIGLVGSALSLGLGGLILLGKVPVIISIGTLIAVLVLLTLTVLSTRKAFILVSIIIGVVEILTSVTSGAHAMALSKFGSSLFFSIVDILMILGFYLFPSVTIIAGIMSLRGQRS